MRTRNFTKGLAVAMVLTVVMSFAACSSEGSDNAYTPNLEAVTNRNDSQQAEAPYSILVRAYSNGSDVTTDLSSCDVKLFVFDQNNEYVKTVNVPTYNVQNKKNVEISAPGTESITVIAWAGTGSSEELTVLNNANLISDLQLTLKSRNGFADLPGDILYGKVQISRSQTKSGDVSEIAVSRKTTNVLLRTAGMSASENDDFYYVVKQSSNAVDCNGKYAGEVVSHIVPAYVSEGGNVTTEHFALFSTSLISVELYRNDELVYSAKNLENNKKVSLEEGKQINLTFDINKTSYSVDNSSNYSANIVKFTA